MTDDATYKKATVTAAALNNVKDDFAFRRNVRYLDVPQTETLKRSR